ncbi:MAG TPA: trigger factor [Candidatus Saccharimonadales bacterium]|nr:trigger factor [Candidatus Saccharimonadales bacterium]
MHIKKNRPKDTQVSLEIDLDRTTLEKLKEQVLKRFSKDLRIPGFRPGKAPLPMVERNVNPQSLQSEFLDSALNYGYQTALKQEDLHPVSEPEVEVKKFVPFDAVSFTVSFEAVGDIALADYKKIRLARKPVSVAAADIDAVIDSLRVRASDKKDVQRAAKKTDQVWIDFKGTDSKMKEPVKGADGTNYPLALGSDTFIPGFETNLIGLKAGDDKTFDLTFPKDYGVSALQNRRVTFTVTVIKVQEVVKPKVDDNFAAKVGPFKTVAELKSDIKKELQAQTELQAEQAYVDELLLKITEQSKVAIPQVLVDEQIDRLINDKKQNLVYRGQTWKEFLDSEDVSEEQYREKLRPDAELRVKAGIMLAEIAEQEHISVNTSELEERLQSLRSQYGKDPQMLAEFDKPETRRSIASRLATEKTIAAIKAYAVAK